MKKIKIFSLILSLLLLAGALTPAALADEQELSAPELRSAGARFADENYDRSAGRRGCGEGRGIDFGHSYGGE